MFKSSLFRIVKKSIKAISALIFMFVIVVVFIVISQINNELEEKVNEQNKYTSFVESDIEARLLNLKKSLNKIQNISTIEKTLFNLSTSLYPKEENVDLLKKSVSEIFFSDHKVESVTIGNIYSEIRITVPLKEEEIIEVAPIKNLWAENSDDIDSIRYSRTFTGKMKLIIDAPIYYNKVQGWYSSLQMDVENLLSDYISDLTERIVVLNKNGDFIYSENDSDEIFIEKIIAMYTNEFFDSKGINNRDKTSINVNDLNYIEDKIITSRELSGDLILVVLQDYDKLSIISIKDQLINILFLMGFVIFGIICIIISLSQRTDTWINTEKQFLNEVIETDKTHITQLNNELKLYQEFLSESRIPIVMIDRGNNKVFMVNPAAARFYGRKVEDIINLDFEEICDLEFEFDPTAESTLITHIKADHTIEERRVKFQEVSLSDSDILVMIILSSTIMSNESFAEIRTEVFHEIRSPLQGAYGANDMIEKATNNYGEYTSIIRRSIKNVLDITNNVLASEKISHDKEKVQLSEFNVVKFVNDLISSSIFQDSNYNQITGSVKLNEDNVLSNLNAYMVKTDIIKLRHVLMNLLSNGSKYTKDGLVTLNVEIKKLEYNDLITFKVSDTGRGLTDDQIIQMYDKFTSFGLKNVNITSSGLGLGVAKKYVELLGSKLEIHSEPNIGSVFSFTIRLEKCDLEVQKNSGSKSILVVDDDEISCEFLKHFFEKSMNYRVKTLTNETYVFDELNHSEYDCVLMDQNLNHFNGIDVIKLIRTSINNRIANVPIILMSAARSKHEISKLSEANISDVILKPFDSDEVRRVVEGLLHNKTERENRVSVCKDINEEVVDKDAICETINIVGSNVFVEMVKKYIINSRSDIKEVDDMVSDESFSDIYIIIHRLKGSMLYFAPVECKEVVREMEDLLSNESYFNFIDKFEIFKDAHDTLAIELRKICKRLS